MAMQYNIRLMPESSSWRSHNWITNYN